MDLRTSSVFFTIFGQCINVLNYNSVYMYLTYDYQYIIIIIHEVLPQSCPGVFAVSTTLACSW